MSTSHSNVSDPEIQEIRNKTRFRVLIIGRANAGKTTILQKICNTTKKPKIYDSNGKKISSSFLRPSRERGLHNIEQEMVFPGNPGFIFHDSRGFESGAVAELESVKDFIVKRSQKTELRDQLHVIWYCIPTDNARLLTKAETTFFDECGTGKVPVIVIFTKFDSQDSEAFTKLQKSGTGFQDAQRQAPIHAKADFDQKHLPRLIERKYPPKKFVYFRDMNKPESKCGDLVEQTADALDDGILRMLFVSTQQDNINICIKYAIDQIVPLIQKVDSAQAELGEEDIAKLVGDILGWFPLDMNVSIWLNKNS